MKADQNTGDQKPAAELPGVKPAENGKAIRQKENKHSETKR